MLRSIFSSKIVLTKRNKLSDLPLSQGKVAHLEAEVELVNFSVGYLILRKTK